jgi:hypothetical protein
MTITISDPWDVVTELGSEPLEVDPIAPMSHDGTRLLCLLKHPLPYRDVELSYLLIHARHVGVTLADTDRMSISCNIVSLSDDEGKSKSMDETIPWEQRIGMIGSFDPRTTGVRK